MLYRDCTLKELATQLFLLYIKQQTIVLYCYRRKRGRKRPVSDHVYEVPDFPKLSRLSIQVNENNAYGKRGQVQLTDCGDYATVQF